MFYLVFACPMGDYSNLSMERDFKTYVTFCCTAISNQVVIVRSRYWNRKGLWVQSLMSDNAPAKTVTVWLWRYDKPALEYFAKSMLTVINYLCCLNLQYLSVPVSTIDYNNLF